MRYANQAKAAAAAAAAATPATPADPATGASSHTHVYSVGKGGELLEPLLPQQAGSAGGAGAVGREQVGLASPSAEDTPERSNAALLRALGDEEQGERATPARGRGAGGGVGLEWLTGMFVEKPRAHKAS